VTKTADQKRTHIPIFFQPNIGDQGTYAVEKAEENGTRKRRYLQGISSGVKLDKHSERMTDKCVKSFMNQANSGDVLLYPDIHGIKASEDIGVLVKGEIQPSGDWFTEYRLYDEYDDIDRASLDTANKIWKQVNGLPPYKTPKQKGFSIEGFIPDGGLLSAQKDELGNMTNRVIDEIDLDGVVVVPRPAYASVATACYKALGEMTPNHVKKIQGLAHGVFKSIMEGQQLNNQYYKMRWELGDVLEKSIITVMRSYNPNKEQELRIVFKEYTNALIPLVLKSTPLFQDKDGDLTTGTPETKVGKASRSDVLKALLGELEKLRKTI